MLACLQSGSAYGRNNFFGSLACVRENVREVDDSRAQLTKCSGTQGHAQVENQVEEQLLNKV